MLDTRTFRERRRTFGSERWRIGEVHRTPVEATRGREDMRDLRWIVHIARQRGGGTVIRAMAGRKGFVFRKEVVNPTNDGDAESDMSSAHTWHC